MADKRLDARTLRWAARKASKYERELRGFERDAPNLRLRGLYERAAISVFVLKSTFLSQARAIERTSKKTHRPLASREERLATTLCGPVTSGKRNAKS